MFLPDGSTLSCSSMFACPGIHMIEASCVDCTYMEGVESNLDAL